MSKPCVNNEWLIKDAICYLKGLIMVKSESDNGILSKMKLFRPNTANPQQCRAF